jgi:hypothetical protein
MAKKTQPETKKKNMKSVSMSPLPISKDWRNVKDYDYMDNHTPELWAWEFLRRNPEYRKDWEEAFAIWGKNKSDAPNHWAHLFGSSCSTEKCQPETLSFESARVKWQLFQPEIINPDIDKPPFEYPFPLFYTYGYYYSKDELYLLSNLNDSEVVAVFDLAKPIQQQLEHFKSILEEEQNDLVKHSELEIPVVKNKPGYWKDQLRIFDAITAGSDEREIASVIYDEKTYNNAQDKVEHGYASAENMIYGGYRRILQQPSKMKKR